MYVCMYLYNLHCISNPNVSKPTFMTIIHCSLKYTKIPLLYVSTVRSRTHLYTVYMTVCINYILYSIVISAPFQLMLYKPCLAMVCMQVYNTCGSVMIVWKGIQTLCQSMLTVALVTYTANRNIWCITHE